MIVVSKVEGAYQHLAFILCINTIGILRIAIANALAIVATQAQTKAWNRVVIQAQGYTILISHFELKWVGSALLNPVDISKIIGIKTSQQLSLITELLITAKERHTRLMPSTGQDGVLALRTVNSKEIQWFVVSIVQAYRHHDMSEAEIGRT